MGRRDGYLPAVAMIGLQSIAAAVALFTRAAMVNGLSPRVFVVYRQGIATLLIAPIAFVSRRKNSARCSLGLKTFAWILLASLLGVTASQNAYFEGLYLSSSTIASAMTNLIPAVTFVLTAILGLEKVSIRSLTTLAKILGTVICVGGAISMALLKGPKLLNTELLPPKSLLGQGAESWLLGCLLLLASSFFWALWMVLQVPISASCPDHLYSSTWMCFLSTLESAIVALLVEKDAAAWSLSSRLELSCCLFTGFTLAGSFFVQAWCISRRGPLFASMFNPLCTVIVTVFAAVFQHEETYTGSLVGAFAVIVGLYFVLWGKAKDLEKMGEEMDPKLLNDQTRSVQVIVDESSDKISHVDLQEPLLSHKSTNHNDMGMNQK
ncbi:Usually multiple acids move in and out Transporters 34 [Hibiscus trionum]|uniref:WAT1-related protein n=1 Tax=Hibiscus trionum TaxID=183268 RepID=A0A9W7J4D4_HIBTR|nr:Usually multiple acids move in and out Transporters 34 [Hibiscus trionum]